MMTAVAPEFEPPVVIHPARNHHRGLRRGTVRRPSRIAAGGFSHARGGMRKWRASVGLLLALACTSARSAESLTPPTTATDPLVEAPRSTAQPAKKTPERYQDGIVIWQTSDDATFPFLLKFNLNTQIRYLNTLDSDDTFTDHLGVVHDVNKRNDITVNRTMFIL